MNHEYEPLPSSLPKLKEKVYSGSCGVFFDVDGTMKGPKTVTEPTGFDPQLPSTLQALEGISGVELGICTSQSYAELTEYLSLINTQNEHSINWNHMILEDGHVYMDSYNNTHDFISPEAKKQILMLHAMLSNQIVYESDQYVSEYGWGLFPGIETPVKFPVGKYQGQYSLSIWEQGPSVTDREYRGQFEPVEAYINQQIHELHFDELEAIEVGNGTLRVLQKGISKASALGRLMSLGYINLAQSIFICDGTNDISAAKKIIEAGGAVIAVANAVPELKNIATVVSEKPQSKGVVEVLQKILIH